ncbi:MAG TPA: hypothetical protein VKB77_03255 [Terriglobales bacterium]|nr:hypothetical protein [Terriglobales bacterium]
MAFTKPISIRQLLSPFGNYSMTAQVFGFRPYRRELFRVTSSKTVAFDSTLPVQRTCDLTIVSSDGGPVTLTLEEWESAKKQLCWREDSFPVPSSDGVPFKVWIRYAQHKASDERHFYTGEKTRINDPVFVTYNRFSLQANEVIYDATSKTINATGSVLATDESGSTLNADATAFKIENGQAIPIH